MNQHLARRPFILKENLDRVWRRKAASVQCIGGGLEMFANTRCKGEWNVIEIS
jgi:hypothetical protein